MPRLALVMYTALGGALPRLSLRRIIQEANDGALITVTMCLISDLRVSVKVVVDLEAKPTKSA